MFSWGALKANSNPYRKKGMSSNQKVCIYILIVEILQSVVIMTVETLTRELQVVRRNLVCERCNEARKPRITPSSRFKPTPSFKPIIQSKSPHKPSPSSRVVNPARRPVTQSRTPGKPDSNAITSTRPLFQTTYQHPPGPDVTHFQPGTLTSPSQLPTTVDAEPCADQHTWSITFNDEVEKELDVEIAHVLFHNDMIVGVDFSPDGKYVAAGGGKAYIYAVQTGTLTW